MECTYIHRLGHKTRRALNTEIVPCVCGDERYTEFRRNSVQLFCSIQITFAGGLIVPPFAGQTFVAHYLVLLLQSVCVKGDLRVCVCVCGEMASRLCDEHV